MVVGLVAGLVVLVPGRVGAAVDPGVGAEGAPELWCSSSQRVALEDAGSGEWTPLQWVTVWVPAGASLWADQEGSGFSTAERSHTWLQFDSHIEVYKTSDLDGPSHPDNPFSLNVATGGVLGKFDLPSHVGYAYTNDTGVSQRFTISIKTRRGLGGADLKWSAGFTVTGGAPYVPPGCPNGLIEESESFGANPALCLPCAIQQVFGDPVDTRTGNQHMGLEGLGVSGRGGGLRFDLAYNSLGSGVDRGVGFGWSSVLSMAVTADGVDRVVTQEGGSTVRFSPDGSGGWVVPDRFSASLVAAPGGGWLFTRNHFERFRFDAAGRLVGFGDQFGNETTIARDGGGQALSMVDEANRQLVFGWNAGRLESVTDGTRSIGLVYDGAGDLVRFTDVGGGVWSYTYEGHRLKSMRKPRHDGGAAGDVVANTYDHLGRVATQTNENGELIRFEYFTPVRGATTITSGSGRKRIDYYNTAGVHTSTVSAPGTAVETVTTLVRDPDTLALEQVTSPSGVVVFENDARGNRVMARDASGRVTRWTYNLFDQVTSVSVGETGAPLLVSTVGVVTSTVAYNADGMPETVVEAAGTPDEAVSSLVYDPVHREDLREVVDGRGEHWLYTYDELTGDLVSVTDPEGNKTSMDYDSIGRLEWVVAPKGNLAGADPQLWKTTVVSDAFGRVIEETDPLGNRVKTGFDANGNMIRVETGLSAMVTTGDVTTYGYDAVDRLTSVDPPGPGARTYSYDADGRRVGFVNELGEQGGAWAYGYDGLGRLVSQRDPAGEVTSYGWDGEGRLGTITQPGGNCAVSPKTGCVTYSYDLAGRPVGVDYADPGTPDVENITYDVIGRRTHASRGGDTEMWVWDQRSRLKSHTDVNGRSTGYGWDDMSNLTSISYPGQSTPVTRAFDGAGRMVSVTDWADRLTTFGYDQNSNWSETVFPVSSQNRDVYSFDRADRMVGVTWNRGSTMLGSLAYGPRDLKGQVTTVTGTGVVAGQNRSWSYDDRDRLTSTGTEGFGFDAATNLVDADGVLQVFDPAQRLCWTSQTVEGGDCGTTPEDATTFGYDARGNRTSMTFASGATATYGFDAENRMTSAVLPTTWQDDTVRQYVPVSATRVADSAAGTGTCDGVPCARIAAGDPVAVKVVGVGGVPATGVTAVVVSIVASGTTSDGWLEVNPAGDAAAGTLPLNAGQTSAQTVTAKVAANGTIVLASDVGVDVSVDVVGYFRAPSPWVPALNYWPVTPAVTAESVSGVGTCDGSPCGTLPAGDTDIATAGHGGIPAAGVNAVTVSIVAQNSSGGHVRVAPNGSASAGELSWEAGSVGAAGVFTVPLTPDGSITLNTAGPTSIRVAVTGYWKIPTGTDTGLGLDLLDAPTRLVDTTNSTGTCDASPCATLQAMNPVDVEVTGQGGLSGDITAVMVSVTAIDPTAAGVVGVGTQEGELDGGIVVFDPAQRASTTMIVALSDTGTITIGSWTETDVAIDVIGVFRAPTRTWRYEYDTTGMRTAKQLDNTAGAGAEWRREFTWLMVGGRPLLLAEHSGEQSALVVHGPGGVPIYQVNKTGEVMYLHQDHQGSTRLTTNANGTTRNTISYETNGQIGSNSNWWLEQPLVGFASLQHDTETGYIHTGTRFYDPQSGQYTSSHPLSSIGISPYSFAGGNPTDPFGLRGAASAVGSWFMDTCGSSAGAAAGCAAFAIGVAALVFGGWAAMGGVAGLGATSASSSAGLANYLAWASITIQTVLTGMDCSHGVDASCFFNAASLVFGGVGATMGWGSSALASSAAAREVLELSVPLAAAGLASSAVGAGFGFPGLSGWADGRTAEDASRIPEVQITC